MSDAKMEILDGCKEDGTFIFNGVEPLCECRAKQVTQSQETLCYYPEKLLLSHSISGHRNQLELLVEQWPESLFSIPIMGVTNVVNACAACLVGRRFHVKPEAMQKALAHFQESANRTQWLMCDVGEQIQCDVTNANPTAK